MNGEFARLRVAAETNQSEVGDKLPANAIERGAECLLRSVSGLQDIQHLRHIAGTVARKVYVTMTDPDAQPAWEPVTGFESCTGAQTSRLRVTEGGGWIYRTCNEGGPGVDTAPSQVWVPDQSCDPAADVLDRLVEIAEQQQEQINALTVLIQGQQTMLQMLASHRVGVREEGLA